MTPKKIIWLAASFTMVAIIFQSCYDVTTVTINNSPVVTKTVSFKQDIIPIFTKSCSISGCHNSGGKNPDLTADKAYASLTIGNYLNLSKPDQSVLYLYLTGKKTPAMPLGAATNPSSINELTLAWITQGAKNN